MKIETPFPGLFLLSLLFIKVMGAGGGGGGRLFERDACLLLRPTRLALIWGSGVIILERWRLFAGIRYGMSGSNVQMYK